MESWNIEIVSRLYRQLEGGLPLRLLAVAPGEHGEPLETELIPTTLEESGGQYEASSYTWGSPDNPQSITCNGVEMKIQKNAYDMLQDLRLATEPRLIWIDAICINQSDNEEKGQQVNIMHHIYSQAKRVLVWLGRPDESSRITLRYALTLDVERSIEDFKTSSGSGALVNWIAFTNKTCIFENAQSLRAEAKGQIEALSAAVVDFFGRGWFSRIWIQQEASLCRDTTVVCGQQVVRWDQLFALAWMAAPSKSSSYLDFVSSDPSRILSNLSAIRDIQRARRLRFQTDETEPRRFTGLDIMLSVSSRYAATDPRDKIYALQNMHASNMSQEEWRIFKVDYDMPWEVLFAHVGSHFLSAGALSFLTDAGRARHTPGTVLPSWAPDYRQRDWSATTIISRPLWRAGGKPYPFIPGITNTEAVGKIQQIPKQHRRDFLSSVELKQFKDAKKMLLQSYATFKCLMSDEIVYMSEDIDNGKHRPDPQDIISKIQKDFEYIRTIKCQTYMNGDSLSDAYKLTLILSSDHEEELVGKEYVEVHWNEWFQWMSNGCPGYWNQPSQRPVLDTAFEHSAALAQFRFAVTKHGLFCLVPRMSELGDHVGIIQGHELAVVLRPWKPPARKDSDHNDEYFELIGDSYAHGMMTGEARCISDEFNCKYPPTHAQWKRICDASNQDRGEAWRTLDLDGQYHRVLPCLGIRMVKVV